MTNTEIIELAENFLNNRKVKYLVPGKIGRREYNMVEVFFLDPLTLVPGIFIDHPEIKVWVHTDTREVELIYLL